MGTDNINHPTLCRLAESGAVSGIQVVGVQGGWTLKVKYGKIERVLGSSTREARLFRKLETMVRYLKKLGLSHFKVDTSANDIDSQVSYSRPDRSLAMKRIHVAASTRLSQSGEASRAEEEAQEKPPEIIFTT